MFIKHIMYRRSITSSLGLADAVSPMYSFLVPPSMRVTYPPIWLTWPSAVFEILPISTQVRSVERCPMCPAQPFLIDPFLFFHSGDDDDDDNDDDDDVHFIPTHNPPFLLP